MLHKGDVEYFYDANGDLWRGPENIHGNLHYAKFEGFTGNGYPIWVARNSDAPRVTLTPRELEEFFYHKLQERHRELAIQQIKEAARRV